MFFHLDTLFKMHIHYGVTMWYRIMKDWYWRSTTGDIQVTGCDDVATLMMTSQWYYVITVTSVTAGEWFTWSSYVTWRLSPFGSIGCLVWLSVSRCSMLLRRPRESRPETF